jgi:hypothetical protein
MLLLRKGKLSTATQIGGLVAVSHSVWAFTIAVTISRCSSFCSIQQQQYAATSRINIFRIDGNSFQQIQHRTQLQPRSFSSLPTRRRSTEVSSSLIVRHMAVGPRQNRGLEQNREQATPLRMFLTLYSYTSIFTFVHCCSCVRLKRSLEVFFRILCISIYMFCVSTFVHANFRDFLWFDLNVDRNHCRGVYMQLQGFLSFSYPASFSFQLKNHFAFVSFCGCSWWYGIVFKGWSR